MADGEMIFCSFFRADLSLYDLVAQGEYVAARIVRCSLSVKIVRS